jgi:hypothetical protein
VVDVTHPGQPTWAQKLFRIEELSHDDTDKRLSPAKDLLELPTNFKESVDRIASNKK